MHDHALQGLRRLLACSVLTRIVLRAGLRLSSTLRAD